MKNIPYISIIIPTYNHLHDLLIPCLDSIKEYTDLDMCEVIVVANGCTDGTAEYLKTLPHQFRHVMISDVCGYTAATNAGIKIARGDYILLLNNDIVLLPQDRNKWIRMLINPHILNNKTGISGPVKFTFPCGGTTRTAMAFWCVMILKKLIDELGYLDEIFSPGMGEDADFSIKAEIAGYDLVQVPNNISQKFGEGILDKSFPIYHKGSGTFGEKDHSSVSIRNTDILKNRYGYKNRLEKIYDICLNHQCDVNQLFPTIRKYAEKCKHITEFGVRGVFSTWAFLATLPTRMVSYDIEYNGNIEEAKDEAKKAGISFDYVLQDVLLANIESTDLLYIDTKHTYKQLKEELNLHSRKVEKFILIHDTVTFGKIGEDGSEGELKAIDEFLLENPHWKLIESITISNGLVVLEKQSDVANNIMKSDSIKIVKKIKDTSPNKKIKYSIIIPTCHNFDIAFKPCLEAVFEYTDLFDKEIIVVANGSPDKAIDYIKGKPVKLIEFKERIGYIRAVNAGIRASIGDYVITLDDDSILQPQDKNMWFNLLASPFMADDKVGASGPFSQSYDDIGHVIHSGCTMYLKSAIMKLGLFDEAFNPGYMGDEDLAIRLRKAGYKLQSVPEGKQPKYVNGLFVIEFPVVHTGNVATMPKHTEDLPIVAKNRQLLYDRHLPKNFESWFYKN